MSSGRSNTPFRGCVVRVRSQRAHRQLTYRAAQLENISEFRMDDRLSDRTRKSVMPGMVTILLVLSGSHDRDLSFLITYKDRSPLTRSMRRRKIPVEINPSLQTVGS
jgi:hypothetical protein